MTVLILLLRVLGLYIFLAVPLAFLGALIFGLKGILISLGFATFVLVLCSIGSEHGIVRTYGVQSSLSPGLKRTLELVAAQSRRKAPNLVVYADPSPNAMVVRSLGSKGTILISQGLASLLSEEELRAVLRWCIYRVQQPTLVLNSICSYFLLLVLFFAPKSWIDLAFAGRTLSDDEEATLSARSAAGFLVVFPMIRYLNRLSKPLKRKRKAPSPNFGLSYLTAIQKIVQAIQIWGPSKKYGLVSLSLVSPGSAKALLPEG